LIVKRKKGGEMSDIFLHGNRAVKVNAKSKMWGVTDAARLYNIDGDDKWIPNSLCEYNEKEGTLIIEEWFYNKLFNNENTV
jgi:hypothetical protein